MKVHVTGAKGFIASHLIPELRLHGHRVTATDVELAFPEVLADTRWEAVVHLGALVGRVRGSAREAITMNTESTAAWAQWAAETETHLLYVSTSEVYGKGHLPLPPAWRLNNLYAMTKAWGEDACRFYLGPFASIARLSMPYGPGHPPGTGRAALTNFLWDAARDRPLYVHEGARRSWLWIGDCVTALRLGLEGRYAGAWNVARADNELTMEEVARQAVALCASRSDIHLVPTPEGFTQVKRLHPDHRLLADGWEPQVGLQAGMRETLAWLKQEGYLDGRTAAAL